MKYEPGEGPIDDIDAAKARGKAERDRPEHAYRVISPQDQRDPRDKAGDADLDDPGKQEKP